MSKIHIDTTIQWGVRLKVMFNKIKAFFIRPSNFDKAIFAEVQRLNDNVKNLDSHIVTLARCALVPATRFHRESLNIKANAEYLVELVKAKDANK